MSFLRKLTLVIFSVFMLTACNDTLYSNLSESDANEMLSTLLKRGVNAQKISAGKTGYNIEVEHEDLIRALEIIKENSLPRQQFDSLGTVFSGQGMISSQTEEQARLAYAISQELSSTFSKIDGVLDARVHVVLVQHEQSSGVTTPPSASIFIRYRPDSPIPDMIAGIKDTAMRAVPGLTPQRVSVLTELSRENILAPKLNKVFWYKSTSAVVGFCLGGISLIALLALIILRSRGYEILIKKKEPKDKIDV